MADNNNNNNINLNDENCTIHKIPFKYFCSCDGKNIKKYCSECMMKYHFGGNHKPIIISEFVVEKKTEYGDFIERLKIIKEDIKVLNIKNNQIANAENIINNNVCNILLYFIIFDKLITVFYRIIMLLKMMMNKHLKIF